MSPSDINLEVLDHNSSKRKPTQADDPKASRAFLGIFIAALIAIWGINQFIPCVGIIGTIILFALYRWFKKH